MCGRLLYLLVLEVGSNTGSVGVILMQADGYCDWLDSFVYAFAKLRKAAVAYNLMSVHLSVRMEKLGFL
jgi:hypothetical protein